MIGELPPKLFFRIGEVAGLVGVEPHVLRYWEREFRSIRPTKSAKGQRVYSRKDVENLLRVRDLLYRDGFTIAGAKKKLQRADEPEDIGEEPVGSETLPQLAYESSLLAAELGRRNGTPTIVMPPDPVPSDGSAETVAASPRVRDKLVALRSEIEAFLVELSGR